MVLHPSWRCSDVVVSRPVRRPVSGMTAGGRDEFCALPARSFDCSID